MSQNDKNDKNDPNVKNDQNDQPNKNNESERQPLGIDLDVNNLFNSLNKPSGDEGLDQMMSGLKSFIEKSLPGGMNGLQQSLNSIVEVATKQKVAQDRAEELTKDIVKIDGNSSVNELATSMTDVIHVLSNDEQFQQSLKNMKNSMSKISNTPQTDSQTQ